MGWGVGGLVVSPGGGERKITMRTVLGYVGCVMPTECMKLKITHAFKAPDENLGLIIIPLMDKTRRVM